MKCPVLFFVLSFLAIGCTPKPTVEGPDVVKTAYTHSYGVQVADASDWKERGSSGQTTQKLRDGSTLTENWNEGKRNGLSMRTFPHNGRPYIEAFYKEDVLLWKTEHYPSGMPKQQNSYSTNGYEVATWYEDGTPKSHETYEGVLLIKGSYFIQDQQMESQIEEGRGERVMRDGFGQLIQKERFSDGVLAIVVLFHSNGMPKSEIPYSTQGKISGLKKNYTAGGEPVSFEEWQEGTRQGITTLFENGERVAEVPYSNYKREGIEKRFDGQTLAVVEEITWKEDVQHGPRILTVDGQPVTEWYFEGEKVTRMQFYTQQ